MRQIQGSTCYVAAEVDRGHGVGFMKAVFARSSLQCSGGSNLVSEVQLVI